MSTVPTGQPVGVIRYMGRCTHEINGGGEGKAIFQSPDHAAAWKSQQAAAFPEGGYERQNVYRCPYFDHYHLTNRQVVMVNGMLVEEGNKASLDAASRKPASAIKDIDTAEVVRLYESVGAAQTAKRLGISTNCVYYRLKKAGIGKGPRQQKDVAPVRKVLFDLDAINDRRAQLRAEIQKPRYKSWKKMRSASRRCSASRLSGQSRVSASPSASIRIRSRSWSRTAGRLCPSLRSC